MTKFKSGIAGALVTALAVAGAAFAQDAATKATQATQATETKAATTQAAPAQAAPAAETKTAAVKATTATATKSSTPRSVIGEVVDPACWIVNGSKGEAHKECALACAKAGQVLAILEKKTNKLFLISTERPGEDPNKGVIDYCGQTVLAKGKFFTRGGFTAIQLTSVEPYNAKAAP
jgi:hypothetical protein